MSAAAGAAVRLAVPLIPVPCGFGNIFARALGHAVRADSIVDLIERGPVRRADIGLAGEDIFLSHRSYGLLEDVQGAVERGRAQPRSRPRRLLAYCSAMAGELLRRMPLSSIDVEVDGTRVAENSALVTVANVETYRGFLTLTPGASPFDGLLDVCALAHASKGRLLAHLIALFLGLPGCWRGVGRWRGSRVAVSVRGRPREDLRVVAGALTVVAPPAAAETLLPRGGARDQVVGRASTAHPRERMATRTIRPTATHTA
jgi:diacylglycerol kinase family enzyme